MKQSRIHVLIVEDDATHGKALSEAFSRAGYQTVWSNTAVKALTAAQRHEFQCLIVDCMLPKMNGVDLVEEIKQLAVNPPKVILFSGIFKDKTFIKSSLERTGALEFLSKPLDISALLEMVSLAFADNEELLPPILELYSSRPMNDNEVLRLIHSETTIHSVHLPMLYRRLLSTNVSGELAITSGVGETSTVSFHNGQIFAVRTPDKDTFFGGLAVGFGFVSPDDVLAALQNKSGKLLGQKLIESMSLSPHAITVILEEQLALRLSQILQGGVVSLAWMTKPFPQPEFALNHKRFEELLADWTRSKVHADWVKSNFALWGPYTLEGHTHAHITDASTIEELFSHADFVPSHDFAYFYRQLLLGNANIGPRGEDAQNFNFLENRLSQLLEDFKVQNHFQVLGVGEKAHNLELNKAFNDLKEHYDPKNLPPDAPPTVVMKCTQVFNRVQSAYRTLSDEALRSGYELSEQNKRTQNMLENEPILRAAILELQNGQAAAAANRFQELLDKNVPFRDLRSYRIWAGLKIDKNFDQISLDQVPPEERHSAPYLMAKGIHYKQRGHVSKALECFRTAHILDPRLGIARKELEKLKQYLERTGNRVLLKEVTNVVDTLFGKIRRGA